MDPVPKGAMATPWEHKRRGGPFAVVLFTCSQFQHRQKVLNTQMGKTLKCSRCGRTERIDGTNTVAPDSSGRVSALDMLAGMQKARIGKMLVDARLITEGDLQEAQKLQENQGGKIVEALIVQGRLDSETFLRSNWRRAGPCGHH